MCPINIYIYDARQTISAPGYSVCASECEHVLYMYACIYVVPEHSCSLARCVDWYWICIGKNCNANRFGWMPPGNVLRRFSSGANRGKGTQFSRTHRGDMRAGCAFTWMREHGCEIICATEACALGALRFATSTPPVWPLSGAGVSVRGRTPTGGDGFFVCLCSG